jgi:hypothetical protein
MHGGISPYPQSISSYPQSISLDGFADQSRRTASTTPGVPRRPLLEYRVDQPAVVGARMKGILKRVGRNEKRTSRNEKGTSRNE